MKHTVSLLGILALVSGLMCPSSAVLADEPKTDTTTTASHIIGKVTYLLGQAELILPDGAVIAITKKTEIPEGSKVSVKDRSKLNLLMVDGATEKLPANSTLEFTKYQYDPADPKASEIRKELTEGEVTSKTGVGGTEAKERYRLNSPLAAIAVLGTEYTVSISGGETRVVVRDGIISMAKLGGSCQRSGLGACADGEQLAASQRGLALVVRKDQPRPVLIPASTPPPVKNTAQTTSAQEQAEEEAADKKAAEEAAAKEKESKLAADKKATEDAAAAKEKESKLAADKKAAEDAAAAKEKESKLVADKKAAEDAAAAKEKAAADKKAAEAKKADKQENAQSTEPAPAKTSEAVVPVAEKPTDKAALEVAKKVDERDPLAEVKAEVKEAKVVTTAPVTVAVQPKTTTVVETPVPVTKATEVVVAEAPKVASNLESTQPSSLATPSTATSTTPTTPAVATPTTATPSSPMILVSAGSSSSSTGLSTGTSLGGLLESSGTGSALLESATGGALTGGLSTTPLSTPLSGTTTDLVESSSKIESTVTTDEGQVIAAVTPPPVVETPVTPVTPALPPVRWGKFDPATVVDGVTLGDQVSSQYAQIIAATTANAYTIERLNGASASLPEQRDVAFALGSYEANVHNATTGTATAATLTDATLNVSSVRNTFDTGFTLNSPVYTGAVKATGTYSATDGILKDDGTNPQTTINGAVGVLGDVTGAAYIFTYQIDPVLNADGALNWTGTAAAPVIPVGTAVAN